MGKPNDDWAPTRPGHKAPPPPPTPEQEDEAREKARQMEADESEKARKRDEADAEKAKQAAEKAEQAAVADGESTPDRREVGNELKDHLLTYILPKFKEEVGHCFMDVWGAHFEWLVGCQENAIEKQKTALDDAKAAAEHAEHQLDRGFAALSIGVGFAGAWFAGEIMGNLYPKYFGKEHVITDGFDTSDRYFVITERHYDHASAHMFGVGGIEFLGHLGELLLEPAEKNYAPPDAKAIGSAPSLALLLRTLKAEIQKQINSIHSNIQHMIDQFQANAHAPGVMVSRLYALDPTLRQLSRVDQIQAGKQLINQFVNSWRESFASKSFYFRNNPPVQNQDKMIQRMEYNMWVLWLRENESDFRKVLNYSESSGIEAMVPYEYFDREGSFFEQIMDHLWDVGLPVQNVLTKHGPEGFFWIDVLLKWADAYQPVDPLAERIENPRKLVPIETWTKES